jgi:hypothetical protein
MLSALIESAALEARFRKDCKDGSGIVLDVVLALHHLGMFIGKEIF